MPVRLKDSPKVQRTRLQSAKWLGNTTALILVVDNDIFVRQSPSDEEDIRITSTGHPDLIYNGIPDWLYQGEVFLRGFFKREWKAYKTKDLGRESLKQKL